MSAEAKWGDLAPRIGSAVALIMLCGVEIYIGGTAFSLLIWVACGLMTWELARMFKSPRPVLLGLLGGFALMLIEKLPGLIETQAAALPLMLAAGLVGAGQVARDRLLYGMFAIWVLAGSYAFLMLRHIAGLDWIIWLVAVVVISDVLGYFAGRMLGGPKFWPRISPKKTWSGTVAGWLGAAVVGIAFSVIVQSPLDPVVLAVISAAAALAGQMGDIAESAVKRRAGVKDSSALIPGHGGLLDRFDAMLGASAFLFALWVLGMVQGSI